MKKKYVITYLLTLVLATLLSTPSFAQIRITQVDPSTNVVTIKNFGGSTVNISSYYFCQYPTYLQASAMTVNSGSLNLAAGADVTITSSVNFGIANGEFGLYSSTGGGTFTSGMIDYLEWGTSGHTREGLAVSLGLWTAGTTITATAPYQYTGNGTTDFGVAFWGTVLGTDDFENQLKFSIFPNPTTSILNLQLSPSFVNGTVSVFDILGKQVLSKEISTNNTARLDVSNISKGLYLIRVSSGENTQTKRFVKQ